MQSAGGGLRTFLPFASRTRSNCAFINHGSVPKQTRETIGSNFDVFFGLYHPGSLIVRALGQGVFNGILALQTGEITGHCDIGTMAELQLLENIVIAAPATFIGSGLVFA